MNNNYRKLVENIDIVEEIGSNVELEHKGNNYVGLCPFHSDNNPSFNVNSEKRIYKCFVCGEGGDVIKFYKKFNHVSNQAAIEALADKYDIRIAKQTKEVRLSPTNYVLNDINKFYVTTMHSTESGLKALEYLRSRGFNNEVINHFHLGFGYEISDRLHQFLEKKIEDSGNYNISNIQELNHFTNERDLFTNRVTIPITKNGNIVGFGGRSISDNQIKYLNSKDSRVFQKKEILFHFDEAMKLSPDRSLIVVEGFFDVIKAYQYSIKNAVALMGTSFSNNHLNQMKRNRIDTVYLSLDSDKAGQDASLKIGELLLKNQFTVKVIEYQDVKDLDEYLNKYSFDDFNALKKNSTNFKIFQVNSILNNISLLSLDEKDQAVNKVVDKLHLENDLVIDQVLTKLEDSMSVSREYLKQKMVDFESKQQPATMQPEPLYDNYEGYDQSYFGQAESEVYENIQESTAQGTLTPKKIVDDNNVSFMSAQQLVVYRSISSKQKYIELKRIKQKLNKQLGIYEQLFNDLDAFYEQYSIFDYVTFTNQYPQYSDLINGLYEKAISENSSTDTQLLEAVKTKTSWGIFGR